jgi:hypothetical protein
MSKPEETKTPPSSAKAEPKTDAKHDKSNPFAPFFDLTNLTKAFPMPFGADAFAPWMREHASKLETISEEIAVFERAMMERIKTNAADMAALVQDTLDYLQQVSGEWRKIAIDTARRAADFTGKA